ncbi:hypothetical protein CGCS363_v007716 [Colletotrichum siamense]|uniref:uncharacterized protein n=1 Tax=Colletotrichum siamense TaxID=690259 RepID=UPI0018724D3B|nr:uncharacterized protein CGCS363_v007716 [Colletotrichum siamense]KAF5497614.1 hypothetical protein CGCS363_v007716 [Colletotrichum siamense]
MISSTQDRAEYYCTTHSRCPTTKNPNFPNSLAIPCRPLRAARFHQAGGQETHIVADGTWSQASFATPSDHPARLLPLLLLRLTAISSEDGLATPSSRKLPPVFQLKNQSKSHPAGKI